VGTLIYPAPNLDTFKTNWILMPRQKLFYIKILGRTLVNRSFEYLNLLTCTLGGGGKFFEVES
jgi:hypothetical protein